jgi:DNA-binding transcriptional LysR family regulator
MDRRRQPRLSLDLLRGFRAAARLLSFTRAAQELNVTQSAVSREVRTLEDQLGQPLFHRVNRALQLTHAGQTLYRATDDALALIDAAAERVAGTGRTLGVTTTGPLASMWLVPRLPRYTRRHPNVDLRIAASHEMLNLDRENLDLAIRYIPPESGVSSGEMLVPYQIFPVCSPRLARDRVRPMRTPADLAYHVRLDFETILYGRPWYDWERWFDTVKLPPVKPSGVQRFWQYDQVIQAALDGNGVAIGKRPALNRHLREGTLIAPFGPEWDATLNGYYLEVATSADRDLVNPFIAWLREEVQADEDQMRPRKSKARQRRALS